jgi:HAE1 family hydrophobic/amphiphilic exporter-1
MIYAGIMLTALLSLSQLEINLYPEIEIPEASVICSHPFLNAQEMEQLVAIPLENALSPVRGVKEIKSVSKDNICSVDILLEMDTDINSADAEIKEKIDIAYTFLPDKVLKPVVIFKNIFETPIMTLGIFPVKEKRTSDIYSLVEKELKTRLLAVEGAAEVRISGMNKREIVIDVDYPKLINTGIPLREISSAVSSSVFNYPVGKISMDIKEFRIKAITDINNLEDIKNLPAARNTALKIEEIADIYEIPGEKTSWFISGDKEKVEECIGVEIIKSGNAGLIAASKKLKKSIRSMNNIFKNDFDIRIIHDSSLSLSSSLKGLFFTIAVGFISASAVLLLIFGSFKISAIVFASLPFSLFIVFIYMFFLKISINIISLSGLAIGCGMVFDNTIVILEKILKTDTCDPAIIGKAVQNTAFAAAGSTVTTVIAFIPVLFIPGITGKLFHNLATSIIIFIIASFSVSVTLTPSLYILSGLSSNYKERKHFIAAKITNSYSKYLIYIKGKNQLKYLLIIIFFAPFFLILFIDFNTAPDGADKKVSAFIAYQPGLDIKEYCDKTKSVIENLLDTGTAESVSGSGGYDNNSPFERSRKEKESWAALLTIKGPDNFSGDTHQYADFIDNYFREWGISAVIRSSSSFMDNLPGAGNESFKIRVTDKNRDECYKKVLSLLSHLESIDKSLEISGNFIKNTPGYKINFDKEKIAESGLTNQEIIETLSGAVSGTVFQLSNFNGEAENSARIRFKKEYADTPFKIGSLKIPFEKGLFDISSSAVITAEMNYPYIERVNRKPAFTLAAGSRKTDKKNLQKIVKEFKEGSIEAISSSISREHILEICALFLSSILMIYLFLGAQFESFIIPLLIMITIPFSLSGSILALFILDRSFNLSSFLGILILSGTTVNTAIILLSEKKAFFPYCLEGMRAILASVLTTAAALVPAALLDKNPVLNNAAAALLGGLAAGSAAVFLIFPMIVGRAEPQGNSSRRKKE